MIVKLRFYITCSVHLGNSPIKKLNLSSLQNRANMKCEETGFFLPEYELHKICSRLWKINFSQSRNAKAHS